MKISMLFLMLVENVLGLCEGQFFLHYFHLSTDFRPSKTIGMRRLSTYADSWSIWDFTWRFVSNFIKTILKYMVQLVFHLNRLMWNVYGYRSVKYTKDINGEESSPTNTSAQSWAERCNRLHLQFVNRTVVYIFVAINY